MYFVLGLCDNEYTDCHQSLSNSIVNEVSSLSKIYEPRPLDKGIDEVGDNVTQIIEKQFILDPCFEKLPVIKNKKMVRCIICYRQANTALLLSKKKKLFASCLF